GDAPPMPRGAPAVRDDELRALLLRERSPVDVKKHQKLLLRRSHKSTRRYHRRFAGPSSADEEVRYDPPPCPTRRSLHHVGRSASSGTPNDRRSGRRSR